MNAATPFNETFATITTIVTYSPDWENGTGYLDHAAKGEHAPLLQPGQMAASVTTNGRKIIFIGGFEPQENLVIFQRYAGSSERIAVNEPGWLVDLLLGVYISNTADFTTLQLLFGVAGRGNIVQRIQKIR